MFNRKQKKIDYLQQELNNKEQEISKLTGELKAFKKLYYEKETNNSLNTVLEENQNLIKWIDKILEVCHIVSTDTCDTITIPIHKQKINYNDKFSNDYVYMQQEEIIIPSIRYVISRRP
jgi:hypothetical protein